MERCCGNCKWWGGVMNYQQCRFPLPVWVMRELHDPLAGHGPMASAMDSATPDCPCFTKKED